MVVCYTLEVYDTAELDVVLVPREDPLAVYDGLMWKVQVM